MRRQALARHTHGGTKTFYLVQGENRRFIKLGRHPQLLSLADAREKVRTIIAKTLGVTASPAASCAVCG